MHVPRQWWWIAINVYHCIVKRLLYFENQGEDRKKNVFYKIQLIGAILVNKNPWLLSWIGWFKWQPPIGSLLNTPIMVFKMVCEQFDWINECDPVVSFDLRSSYCAFNFYGFSLLSLWYFSLSKLFWSHFFSLIMEISLVCKI